jgi:hypothetical protein
MMKVFKQFMNLFGRTSLIQTSSQQSHPTSYISSTKVSSKIILSNGAQALLERQRLMHGSRP